MPVLRLVYLPTNMAWAFVFGDQLVRLQTQERHTDNRLLFPNRTWACSAALALGLAVYEDGSVHIPND